MKAFPNMNKDIHPDVTKDLDLNGMDLRDYFAAKAMQVIMDHSLEDDRILMSVNLESECETLADALKRIPKLSYQYADAMMEARND